jgi:hypothetical protein
LELIPFLRAPQPLQRITNWLTIAIKLFFRKLNSDSDQDCYGKIVWLGIGLPFGSPPRSGGERSTKGQTPVRGLDRQTGAGNMNSSIQ